MSEPVTNVLRSVAHPSLAPYCSRGYFAAFDVNLRMEVALKALRADLVRDDCARDLLRREVPSARQVVSANVCRVFDLVVEDGHEMVSMEFVDGTTLAELLAEKGPLDLSRAGEIAGQLLADLEAIHFVVDQAEELFTLNRVEVQHRFSQLLGRLVLDADRTSSSPSETISSCSASPSRTCVLPSPT